jgi:hypothetical protein
MLLFEYGALHLAARLATLYENDHMHYHLQAKRAASPRETLGAGTSAQKASCTCDMRRATCDLHSGNRQAKLSWCYSPASLELRNLQLQSNQQMNLPTPAHPGSTPASLHLGSKVI